jgi:hypothetical protein
MRRALSLSAARRLYLNVVPSRGEVWITSNRTTQRVPPSPIHRWDSRHTATIKALIKVGRRGRTHRSMRDINRAGNMASPVGFRGSCIDKKNLVSSPKSLAQVTGINFVLELRFVVPKLIVHG